jgi:glycosyltransferase involved in cell wall biosynthesis
MLTRTVEVVSDVSNTALESNVDAGRPGSLPRRVLHVLNGATGGAALSTLELIAEFRKAGIDSIVVSDDGGSREEKQLVSDAVGGRALYRRLYWWNRKIRAPAWRRPLIELNQKWQTGLLRTSTADVVAFARKHDVDLIHTNTSLTPEGGLAARELGLPHVWHLRELIGPGFPYRFPLEGPAFGAYLQSLASVVVANSSTTARAVQGWMPNGLLRTVPNGINLEKYAALRSNAHDGRVVAAMVANLSSTTKKQSLFFEAATLVPAATPVEFRIYGHLPSSIAGRTEWETTIRKHQMEDRFRLAGFMADPARIMSEIDVLVHTSDRESFGRVAVEAMAAGKPVVGVGGGGIAEIVVDGETGLLSEPDDRPTLARHIERLARDAELRARLGAAGRRRAESEYDIRRCAARMLEIYAEAVSRPLNARCPQA